MPSPVTLRFGYTWDIFVHTGNTSLFSNVAGIAKPECCTCRFCNKIARTTFHNIHRIELFATCCRLWGHMALHVQRLRLLLQNSFEDVEMPVQVENSRCSHGFRQYFTCCYVAGYVVNTLSDHGYQPIRLQDSGKVHR